MVKKSAAKEPAWSGPDRDIPSGLPGRAGCMKSIREDAAANDANLAGRARQRIVAGALANAKKTGRGK